MLDIDLIKKLSEKYEIPMEDSVFIALNTTGVDYDCGYDRMRGQLHVTNTNLFPLTVNESYFYFALPVHKNSPFKLNNNKLLLNNTELGLMEGTTEDICNSHYWRRERTSLNINPNQRTSCRGCNFCYAIYQIPHDNKKLLTKEDFKNFFVKFLDKYDMKDLGDLIELSVVTGCYTDSNQVIETLKNIKHVADNEFNFKGRLLYLGSQISTEEDLQQLVGCQPMRICFSIETFENRNKLRESKSKLSIEYIKSLMLKARKMEFEVTYSYVLGLEPLNTVEKYFNEFREVCNVFPIVNLLQIHNKQSATIKTPEANNIEYFFKARKIIEKAFRNTALEPEVWNNYRSPWTMRFANKRLSGKRIPHPIEIFNKGKCRD